MMAFAWTANAQQTASTAASDMVEISADSEATVLEWFRVLEQQGWVLAYNASSVNVAEKVTLKRQEMTVEKFMESLLYPYVYDMIFTSKRKILLQIRGLKQFSLSGKVIDGSERRGLDGCCVVLKKADGAYLSTLTDADGNFNIKLTAGRYMMMTSYVGFEPWMKQVTMDRNRRWEVTMDEAAFALKEVVVNSSPITDDVNSKGAISALSVGDDPMAKLYSLPGVTGSAVGGNLHVNGGQSDENLILMDGISIYHSHHNNSLLAQFNSETVEKINFYDSFIPAQYEGRLSSVTDVRMKQGDDLQHHQAIGLKLPSAFVAFDGPIVKEKLTYMVSARHSWVDFLADLFSDAPRLNRTFWDVTGKVCYHIKRNTTLEALAYASKDSFNESAEGYRNQKLLGWENGVYALSINNLLPSGISQRSMVAYTGYNNRIFAPMINIDVPMFVHEGMKRVSCKSDFTAQLEEALQLAWGVNYAHEWFDLLASQEKVNNVEQNIDQLSAYANAKIHIGKKLDGSAALNMVVYLPKKSRGFFSVQPRFTLRYRPRETDIVSVDFSRMEQFYHNVCLGDLPVPTDMRMPSINGLKPSSSVHGEVGWKHLEKHWRGSVSAFYKRRFRILGLRYEMRPELEEWNRFIMCGNGESFGVKLHSTGKWDRWMFDLSYTYSRSYEWFADHINNRREEALHDLPHLLKAAASYRTGKKAYVTLGGYVQSGYLENVLSNDFSTQEIIIGRNRNEMNYRLDLNYSDERWSKSQKVMFAYRVGLYNIVGRPKDSELLDLYAVGTNKHCLPYFTLKLKF